MNDIWLFIEHGRGRSWSRAEFPERIQTVRDLILHLQRGGEVDAYNMEIPKRPRFAVRIIGMTVVARLENE
jgi:hypothetical protein